MKKQKRVQVREASQVSESWLWDADFEYKKFIKDNKEYISKVRVEPFIEKKKHA